MVANGVCGGNDSKPGAAGVVVIGGNVVSGINMSGSSSSGSADWCRFLLLLDR